MKHEAVCRQAGNTQGGNGGASAGYGNKGNVISQGLLNKQVSRIGYPRRSSVRDVSNIITFHDFGNECTAFFQFIMFVKACKRGIYVIGVQEFLCSAGVLGGNNRNMLKYLDGAQGYILQIADGRCHYIQSAFPLLRWLFTRKHDLPTNFLLSFKRLCKK